MGYYKQPCGCHISHIGHQPEQIVYCPLHAAAEEMLAALRIAKKGIQAIQDRKDFWDAEDGKMLDKIIPAITKATGKES